MKLSDAVAEFVLARDAEGLSTASLSWYKSILTRFAGHLVGREIGNVSASDIRRYMVEVRERYSDDSFYGHARALHAFWRWSTDEYRIENPMRNIRYPKQPTPKMPRRVETSDIAKMLDSLPDDAQGIRDRAIILFLYETGCRAAGLCRLTTEHLDIDQRRAYVHEKGDKWRAVFFGQDTAAALLRWYHVREPVEAVFYNLKRLTPLTPNGLLQVLYRIADRAGVTGNVHPHAFRHRFGQDMIERSSDLNLVSKLMGHESTEVTEVYARMDTDHLSRAHQKTRRKIKVSTKKAL